MEARKKIMDYLARRSHSELELREKLSKNYDSSDVEEALRFARENKWLENPEELAAKVAETLARKGKGRHYISAYLRKKGLPEVQNNRENEIARALSLVEKHLDLRPPFAFDDRAKIFRLLQNRGYDYGTIQALFHDSF